MLYVENGMNWEELGQGGPAEGYFVKTRINYSDQWKVDRCEKHKGDNVVRSCDDWIWRREQENIKGNSWVSDMRKGVDAALFNRWDRKHQRKNEVNEKYNEFDMFEFTHLLPYENIKSSFIVL